MLSTIYKEEDGSISAVKLASETPEEAQELLGAVEHYKAKPVEDPAPVDQPVDPVPVDPAEEVQK